MTISQQIILKQYTYMKNNMHIDSFDSPERVTSVAYHSPCYAHATGPQHTRARKPARHFPIFRPYPLIPAYAQVPAGRTRRVEIFESFRRRFFSNLGIHRFFLLSAAAHSRTNRRRLAHTQVHICSAPSQWSIRNPFSIAK